MTGCRHPRNKNKGKYWFFSLPKEKQFCREAFLDTDGEQFDQRIRLCFEQLRDHHSIEKPHS